MDCSVTGDPAIEESDFLRQENDRLNSELRNAHTELKNLKTQLNEFDDAAGKPAAIDKNTAATSQLNQVIEFLIFYELIYVTCTCFHSCVLSCLILSSLCNIFFLLETL